MMGCEIDTGLVQAVLLMLFALLLPFATFVAAALMVRIGERR